MAKEKKSGFVEKSEKDTEAQPKGNQPVVEEQKQEEKVEEVVNPHAIGVIRTDKYNQNGK